MKYGHLQTDPEEFDIWSHGDPKGVPPFHPALDPERLGQVRAVGAPPAAGRRRGGLELLHGRSSGGRQRGPTTRPEAYVDEDDSGSLRGRRALRRSRRGPGPRQPAIRLRCENCAAPGSLECQGLGPRRDLPRRGRQQVRHHHPGSHPVHEPDPQDHAGHAPPRRRLRTPCRRGCGIVSAPGVPTPERLPPET